MLQGSSLFKLLFYYKPNEVKNRKQKPKMEILYNVAIYVVGHHTHKAGGSSLFCVPGTNAVHSKNGK